MRTLGRHVPALALMALGWKLSDTPDLSSGIPGWDTLLRKGAHVTEFGLLLLAWWWATGARTGFDRPAPYLLATAVALAWAALDEVHQTWVAGRHGTPVDWCIDAAGVGLAVALVLAVRARGRRAAERVDLASGLR